MLRLSGAFYVIASVAFNSHVSLLEAKPLPAKAIRREELLMMQYPDPQSFARGGATDMNDAVVKTMPYQKIKILNFLAGGVAGTIASCITNPLEVIKSQMQSSLTSKVAYGELASSGNAPIQIARRILQVDGVKGFWRGLRPTLIGVIPTRSIYFYVYEQSKNKLALTNKEWLPEGGMGNALLSGFAAGAASTTVTNPLWLVKTRMQLMADQSVGQAIYKNHREVVLRIMREEGIGGFYRGLSANYWICTEGALQFLMYEQIKAYMLDRGNAQRERDGLEPAEKLSKWILFVSAACAKSCAALTTYPFLVARTRMREQARSGVFKYNGMWQTIGVVTKEEGRSRLYAGLGVHMIKVVPNHAIMFVAYEIVNSWLSGFEAV